MKIRVCSLLLLAAAAMFGGPQTPHGAEKRAEDERHRQAMAKIDAELTAARKQHDRRVRACPTSQCKLDESKAFREENARLGEAKRAEQELHRAILRGEGPETIPGQLVGAVYPQIEAGISGGNSNSKRPAPGLSPPLHGRIDNSQPAPESPKTSPEPAGGGTVLLHGGTNQNQVFWADWHYKFGKAIHDDYLFQKEALRKQGKVFPSAATVTVFYTVNRNRSVTITKTTGDQDPLFRKTCTDAVKNMANRAETTFPEGSKRSCVRKTFEFNTSYVTPRFGAEDVEQLPSDPRGTCPEIQ